MCTMNTNENSSVNKSLIHDRHAHTFYTASMAHRIVIVGGGFGGVTAALRVAKKRIKDAEIVLISDKTWLEYYGVLYRLIGGASRAEAAIPFRDIFGKLPVKTVKDTVQSVDTKRRAVTGTGKKTYSYDTLILAPGSVPAYFHIPGMEKHSITLKSIDDALAIRALVKDRVSQMKKVDGSKRRTLGRFAVIGGGPTGIEIASELLPYARSVARSVGLDMHLIAVDVIEAANRILPSVEPDTSVKVLHRLQQCGVTVHLNRTVSKAAGGSVTFSDGTTLPTGTVFWTAGVNAHPLMKKVTGLTLDEHGRASVDNHLRSRDVADIYVIGDCAAAQYVGMAQTAYAHGKHVADVIAAELAGTPLPTYHPEEPAYAIPVGGMWAAVKFKSIRAYGFFGYVLRRAADIHVYALILPWYRVPAAFLGMKKSVKR